MRSLSATLLAAQKSSRISPLWKVVLTHGATEYTYTQTRILKIDHSEEAFSHKATITLDNSDAELTAKDLNGYKAVLSYGITTSAGAEYSACAPLWVLAQRLESVEGKLACVLEAIGIPNLMAEDRASVSYIPSKNDAKTVKGLINAFLTSTTPYTAWVTATVYAVNDYVRPTTANGYAYICTVAGTSGGTQPTWPTTIGSTVTDGTVTWKCSKTDSPFSHCPAYTVTWDSEDTLIDVYAPKDGFRIYTNGSRLAALRRLLDWTKCVARFRADGYIHILQPTVSGETYDYEYSLTSGEHNFFSKAYRKRLVVPNKITVRSREDDTSQYTGSAADSDSYTALGFYQTQFEETYLASDAQAVLIATALLSKYQMWAEAGSGSVPMNVGAEVYDYVKVTDAREGDTRIGNIGKITRKIDTTKTFTDWKMDFNFGGWLSVRDQMNSFETLPSGFGSAGQYFSKLTVKDLYVENILADNCSFVWLDPDNTINLALSGSNLDELANGTTYARVKSASLNASGLVLLDQVVEGTYGRVLDASLSAAGLVLLDQTVEGTYGLTFAAELSAHHLKLTSSAVISGEWYRQTGVVLSATAGLAIFGGQGIMGLRTFATEADFTAGTPLQCYVGTDGKIYAGAGAVALDANGITIIGQANLFKDANSVLRGYIYGSTTLGLVISAYGDNVYLLGNDIVVGASILPGTTGVRSLGDGTHRFLAGYINKLYANTRLEAPVGADMADFYLTAYEHNVPTGAYGLVNAHDAYYSAQTFTPSANHTVTGVRLLLGRGGDAGLTTVSIKATDGSGHPTGDDLCSGQFYASLLPENPATLWYVVDLGAGVALTATVKYAIVITAPNGDNGNYVTWHGQLTPPYTGGIMEYSQNWGVTWTADGAGQDCSFYEGILGTGGVYGFIWVEGDAMHYIDSSGLERVLVTGTLV